MREQLPALIVVIPLIAAPLCIVLRRLCPAWLPAVAATGATFVAAVALYLEVSAGAVFEYAFGGWQAPWGVVFRVDALNAPIAVLLTFVALVIVVYARASVAREISPARLPFFYALLMLCVTGLAGIAITQDLFNAFVFIEIAALASYALVGLSVWRDAARAAFRYLIIGSVGTTFFLIGVAYMYMLTGTLNYVDMSLRVDGLESSRVFLAAMAFIAGGLAMKIALFPLHVWLPGTYATAPSAVSGFLAAVSAKAPLYLLVRLYFDVFKPGLSVVYLDSVFLAAASVAVIYASWRAIRIDDVKKLLAFSSIGQVAYIILGVSLATPAGLSAAWIQFFSHALTKGGLFLAVGCVIWRHAKTRGDCRLDDLHGLGRRAPWTAAAITVGGLGLIGVPLTAGFVGKWHLVLALIDASHWLLLAVVLPGSLLAVVYVWRMVEAMYFVAPAAEQTDDASEPPPSMVFLSWVLIGATVYFGVQASGLVRMAERAAGVLL